MAKPIRIAEPGAMPRSRHPFVQEGGTQFPSAASVVNNADVLSLLRPGAAPIYYRHLGLLYRVWGLYRSVDEANAFMSAATDVGLLAVTDDGYHVLVSMTDKGMNE